VTLSPPSLVFGALSDGASVKVTATESTCRWTARSDASWLAFPTWIPNRSGSGEFVYSVPGNNTVTARDANIVVSVDGGPASLHRIHQERPAGCVYSVSPEKLTFGRAGGVGSFRVNTIPNDCQWRITDSWSSVQITSATSATGSGTVTYIVAPNGSGGFDREFRVQGLSGLNPPGIHVVRILP
jgi:hypothetical protein